MIGVVANIAIYIHSHIFAEPGNFTQERKFLKRLILTGSVERGVFLT